MKYVIAYFIFVGSVFMVGCDGAATSATGHGGAVTVNILPSEAEAEAEVAVEEVE